MSTSITIGEVPDEVRDELKARAALCGCTVEEYIRDELIALARRPSAAVWMARVRARKDALQAQPATARSSAPGCSVTAPVGGSEHGEGPSGGAETCGLEPHADEPHGGDAVGGDSRAGDSRGEARGSESRGSEPRASEAPLAEPQRDVG